MTSNKIYAIMIINSTKFTTNMIENIKTNLFMSWQLHHINTLHIKFHGPAD